MGRLIKSRRVDFIPQTREFMPLRDGSEDVGDHKADGVYLKLEELEAMRLRDIGGLTQQECADIMDISRQTFQNIIANARQKVTMALIEGRPLSIQGGHYRFEFCRLWCKSCNRAYEIEYTRDRNACPICSSENITCRKQTGECVDWCFK
ncbi:MAG: DUF134 domain-containing protein [Tissierellia bacterium]|nr:DUF134 domain-containing protein [Tissierellia bacterium]